MTVFGTIIAGFFTFIRKVSDIMVGKVLDYSDNSKVRYLLLTF